MPSTKEIKVLYCCSDSNTDEEKRQKLEKHLSSLKQKGVITTWHKGMISAGKDWESEIYTQMDTADIILLLISSDLIYSQDYWNIMVKRAMERHNARQARVIPILLTTVDNWRSAFGFSNLKALPEGSEGEKPVTKWGHHDHAFANIAKGIREVIEEITASPFSLKSYPQVRTGMTAIARTLANVPDVSIFLLPKKSRARRRNRAGVTRSLAPFVIGALGGTIAISQLSHLVGNSSLVPNLTLRSTKNVTSIGWIWIGTVNNNSGNLSVGEPLIEISSGQPAPTDSLGVPSIRAVVTVKNKANLRKDKSQFAEQLGQVNPGEKLVILKVEPLVNHSSNSPRMKVWAEVGRCDHACDN
ncbi:toll/interleukin-1 receptor domain-containing protein [Coleofasciculus sp. FACHB-1120]|uniref:toll/interleukin-1 receptor domain-containing protein n=1 Tax=Coleofasciculus sp. FACHB-1120 TaxID=2692783 RepID=UPI001682C009|nr:toll/interleukin-1 receptor domain-containing protein [Coleofasciculus sp. FACHB-1120]MBD2743230.1 toll/interleukin-1 receptor domain-containing protein [Coleofasciculus sp. FACHB-1120]